MVWQDWAKHNIPGTYGETLQRPWDRWNDVVIDRCPPEDSGLLFQQIRAAMVCLQSLQDDSTSVGGTAGALRRRQVPPQDGARGRRDHADGP
eukprot:12509396-Alexandrium_andersonii.AAC.1